MVRTSSGSSIIFFLSSFIHSRLNSNFMVLILKENETNTIDKFQPIVLVNFLFKIITEILVDKLVDASLHIVFANQFGLIRVSYIDECIMAASICVNLFDQKCFGGKLASKIDIHKTFAFMNFYTSIRRISIFLQNLFRGS